MSQPDKQEAMSRLAASAPKVPAPHAKELCAGSGIALSTLDGRAVGVHLGEAAGNQVLQGRAKYEIEASGKGILRVIVSESPHLEFEIEEAVFGGRIQTGEQHGCDFLVCVGAGASEQSPLRESSKSR